VSTVYTSTGPFNNVDVSRTSKNVCWTESELLASRRSACKQSKEQGQELMSYKRVEGERQREKEAKREKRRGNSERKAELCGQKAQTGGFAASG
jgi:hypothetical protein